VILGNEPREITMPNKQKPDQHNGTKDGNDPNESEATGSQPKHACPEYLGPYPISLGENAKNYDRLLSDVAGYYAPSDPVEWIHVRDIADYEWQKQRMRRAIASCIDLAAVDAIERVLKSRGSSVVMYASQYAEGYLVGSEPQRSFVLKFLRERGLTEESFTSTAVSMRAADIERMERSAMLHQACRDEAVRCLERHRANKAATLPKPPVEDADYRVIEDKSKDKKEAA
jgi:hypothetical protein